jgi:hypothetical protein
MAKMLAKAQKMQEKVQEEISELRIRGSAGGGAVTATVDGNKMLLELAIAPEVFEDGDPDMASDLVLAAVNDAQRQADEEVQKKMSALSGSLGLPPGMGL